MATKKDKVKILRTLIKVFKRKNKGQTPPYLYICIETGLITKDDISFTIEHSFPELYRMIQVEGHKLLIQYAALLYKQGHDISRDIPDSNKNIDVSKRWTSATFNFPKDYNSFKIKKLQELLTTL